jgi:hypothetical protein
MARQNKDFWQMRELKYNITNPDVLMPGAHTCPEKFVTHVSQSRCAHAWSSYCTQLRTENLSHMYPIPDVLWSSYLSSIEDRKTGYTRVSLLMYSCLELIPVLN